MANTFPFSDPVGVGRSQAASIGLEAIDHRRGQGALSAPMHGNTFGTLSGVFPGGTSGDGPSNDLACTGYSGRTLTFNAGHYACDRGTGNLYLGMAYSGWSIDVDTGDAVNPRIDAVVIRNRDPGLAGETSVTESARPTVLKGTAAASPTKPTGLITNGDVLLGWATVGGGGNANSVLAWEDARLFVEARGAIRIRPVWDTRNGAYEGQFSYNLDRKMLEVWTGSEWSPVASPAQWTNFTPTLFSEGAGAVNLGSGGIALGAYQLFGKTLRVRYYFEARRPCNLGYGPLYTRLPAGLVAKEWYGDHHGRAQLNTQAPAYLEWMGDSACVGGTNRVYARFNKTITDNTFAQWRVASSAGQAGNGIPQLAGEYPDPLRGMSMSLEVEIA